MVCPESQIGFRRLVTLLEILRAYAGQYVELAVRLDIAMLGLETRDIWQDTALHGLLVRHMDSFGGVCEVYDLAVTRKQVDKIIYALRDEQHTVGSALFTDYLKELRNRFIHELDTKLFFQVPSSKRELFDSPWTGWEEIRDRFQDTTSDIEEMSKCFSLSRYAGCVFHSLLIVERGLIELGHEIGVTDPKPGWDATCGKMEQLLDGGHGKYPLLKIGFSVLEQINQAAQSMKHAWRNKVSHAAGQLTVIQADFAPDVAEEIMLATRSFMRRLATDLPQLIGGNP